MTLFFTLLPLYLFGNIHCLGMCGPLVMLIGRHRFRYFYFFGRLCSFSLAGGLAGELGAVLHLILKKYYLSEAVSFFFGSMILWIGIKSLFHLKGSGFFASSQPFQKINRYLSTLLLKDTKESTFLFGFFTVFLPCGQTLVVFSACALTQSALIGLFNGFALAFLTTPSLIVAMHAYSLFKKFKKYYQLALGLSSILVSVLAFCRGFAEMGWISHWVLNSSLSSSYHIVIF